MAGILVKRRLLLAQTNGPLLVPTLRIGHLSDQDKRAFIIADNRLAEKAGWDPEILAIELQGLIELDFDVELTGSTDMIIKSLGGAAQESPRGPGS